MSMLKKLVIDMIPVVLGVLIALFINEWKQNSDNKRFLANVFESVDKEMELNIMEFNKVLPKQQALIDTVRAYMDNDQIQLVELVSKANGIQVPSVRNTSWKSFLNSKMELVNFETISQLTDIDESKQLMGKKLDGFMDFIIKESVSTSTDSKKLMVIQLLNLIDSEQQLLHLYQTYLDTENKSR
jgi:hypothetical protein